MQPTEQVREARDVCIEPLHGGMEPLYVLTEPLHGGIERPNVLTQPFYVRTKPLRVRIKWLLPAALLFAGSGLFFSSPPVRLRPSAPQSEV